MSKTRWPELSAYLERRRPDLCRCFKGATAAELRALFGHSPSAVPQAVLDIHTSLGQDDGGYLPLGPLFTLSVDTQLEDMDEAVVASRFLRFALAIDHMQMDEADLYVDLESSDGYDAPILQVCEPWDGRTPHALCHSVMSKAIQHAHETIELQPRAEFGYLSQSMPRENLADYIDAFDRLAARIGLQEALVCRPELRCGTTEGSALMFDALGPGIPLGANPVTEGAPSHLTAWVWIGADDLQIFRNLVEQVRDHMPLLSRMHRRTADNS